MATTTSPTATSIEITGPSFTTLSMANVTNSSLGGTSTVNTGSSNDNSAYQRSLSDNYGLSSGYSSMYVAVSIMVCVALILLTVCSFIKRRRAAHLLQRSLATEGQQANPEWNANGSAHDQSDVSAFAAPSYATVVANGYDGEAMTNGTNTYDMHLHRHYAVGDEPPSVKQFADLPPSYDDVTMLNTPVRCVSSVPYESGSCITPSTTGSTESTHCPSTVLATPTRSALTDGYSNSAFRNDESEPHCVPAEVVQPAVSPVHTMADTNNELPPPDYGHVVGRTPQRPFDEASLD